MFNTKTMRTPFPTHKLLFIKDECVVRMCASHAEFSPAVHKVLAEIVLGEMMR